VDLICGYAIDLICGYVMDLICGCTVGMICGSNVVMKRNNPDSIPKIVVPVVIAVIVMWFLQTGPFAQKAEEEPPQKTSIYADSWYPVGEGLSFTYNTKGRFYGEAQDVECKFTRVIHRKAGRQKWQAVDSLKGNVVDNYFLEKTEKGVEITSTGLNKNQYLLLPAGFGMNSTWNISSTLRGIADGTTEDIEISVIVNGKKKDFTFNAVRVRYDRYYGEKVTTKPDWCFESYAWFVKGFGIVKEDSKNAQIPEANGTLNYKDTWETKTLSEITGKGF